MQKAMLVFTDQDDGNVGVNLSFDPVVKPNDKLTPAISMAFDALELLKSQQRQADAGKESDDE
ncbi:hypothetical protein D9M71_406560 [compost metagenome]